MINAPVPSFSVVRMMTRSPLSYVLVSAWLLYGLTSCSHPRVDDFEASVGRLTQDEFIHRFGYPQRLKQLPTGGEVWEYEFLAGGSRCVGYRVFFDQELRSQRWERLNCR